ncbi:MAG: hypothetical protein QM754_20645 [Tepidisphaeraceae bacterium]
MAAVLRVSGPTFDVARFVVQSRWTFLRTFQAGRSVHTTFPDRVANESGFVVSVSEAGLDEFDRQIVEATQFLKQYSEQLRQLWTNSDVLNVTIDFAIAMKQTVTISVHFPASLVELAGPLGISLEASFYPVSQPH